MLQAWASKVRAGKGSKGDRLGLVDHATITYAPFRKNFYIEVCYVHLPERMSKLLSSPALMLCCNAWHSVLPLPWNGTAYVKLHVAGDSSCLFAVTQPCN